MGNLVDKSDLLYFHPCGLEIPYVPVFARNDEVSVIHGKMCSNIFFLNIVRICLSTKNI